MPALRKYPVIDGSHVYSGSQLSRSPAGTTLPPPFSTTTTLHEDPRQSYESSAFHYPLSPDIQQIQLYTEFDLMSSRPLGLGSRSTRQRAPIELNGPSLRPSRPQAPAPTKPTTNTHNPQISNSAAHFRRHQQQANNASARRGFGLFESDADDTEPEPEHKKKTLSPTTPVKFSGDTSGFAGLRAESLSAAPTPASGSRKSAHTTPSRPKSTRPTRRQTPYARKTSTTALALQRAGHSPTTDDEDLTIGETMEMRGSDGTQKRNKRRGSGFTMSGARGGDVEMSDGENKEKRGGKKATVAGATMNRTWGQWLRSIVPDSIKKPFGFSGTESEESSPSANRGEREDSQDRDNLTTGIPGSFDERMQNLAVTSPKSKQFTETHIPDPTGLFTYEKNSQDDSMAVTPVRRGYSVRVVSPPTTLRKQSNFLERMKSGKSSKRYEPYIRNTSRSITTSPTEPTHPEEIDEARPEDTLELLEQRKRARKVQEAEDRYLRRQLMRDLGREGELSDSDSEVERKKKVQRQERMKDIATSPIKQTRRAITTGSGEDADMNDGSTTPPSTPPKVGGGLFGGSLYSKPAPSLSFGTTSTSTGTGPDEGNKENDLFRPPPPPSPSHRQLPNQSSDFSAPSVPPAPSQLFPEKAQPVGGFGLSDPAPAPQAARARFEKHKPRVSSSLRNEASAANKETDEAAKENATPADFSSTTAAPASNPFGKPAKAGAMTSTGGTQTTTSTSTGGIFGSSSALREVESNAFMGPGDKPVKIDMRAKIAAMPVQDLMVLFQWPVVEVPKNSMRSSVESAWKADNDVVKAFMTEFSSAVRV